MVSSHQQQRYTYGDIRNWPEEERWELLEGIPHGMSPGPSRLHQKVVVELIRQIGNFFIDKTCEVYTAPFDVRLPEADEADPDVQTVVQPDIVVVCDPEKLDEQGCRGAPDFVIEVLSPATAARDLLTKANLYEKHGVREYWAIHPTDRLVYMHIRQEDGTFAPKEIFEAVNSQEVKIFPGLLINFDLVFRD